MPIERQAHRATSFEEAARCDREQHWRMTPDERLEIARQLRDRIESERSK
jgi:hypothetical protein